MRASRSGTTFYRRRRRCCEALSTRQDQGRWDDHGDRSRIHPAARCQATARGHSTRREGSARRSRPPAPRRPPAKLNIGGGNWYRRGWHNVDLYALDAFVDFRTDFRTGDALPLADASITTAFSSHVVEHISDEEVANIAAEVARVMRPGGTFRISTPDPDKAFAAYDRGDHEFFDRGGVTCKGPTIEHKLVNFFASYRAGDHSGGPEVERGEILAALDDRSAFPRWCVEQIPADAPYRGHVNSWSGERLRQLLLGAGFVDVRVCGYRQSFLPELREDGFDNRPTVSVFVEAVR